MIDTLDARLATRAEEFLCKPRAKKPELTHATIMANGDIIAFEIDPEKEPYPCPGGIAMALRQVDELRAWAPSFWATHAELLGYQVENLPIRIMGGPYRLVKPATCSRWIFIPA